ncbi:MAG TPA: polymer-forming cytoskeletal protein [Egibacteraceae bacterium]|mgnify:CR=1 FL=1
MLRILSAAILVLVLVAGWPATALAATAADETDAFVVLSGPAVVGADERYESVVVALGDVTVDGTVDEVVVGRGDVTVSGTVNDTVVALDGLVTVADGGRVGGDVTSSQRPVVAPGGEVAGAFHRIDLVDVGNEALRLFGVYWWVATTVSLLLLAVVLVLVLPRGAAAAVDAAAREPAPAAVSGLLLAVGVPLAAVLLAATLVGVPLAVGLSVLVGPVVVLGYLTAGALLGALILRRRDQLLAAAVVGVGLLQLLAVVPFAAPLLWLAAIYGTGALAVAAWRHGHPVAPAPRPAPPAPAVTPSVNP